MATIGDWTESQLVRFIQNIQKQNPTTGIDSFTADSLVVVKKLTCGDQLQLMQSQTTVGAAGNADALPVTPSGYFLINDRTGNSFVVPYYSAS